MELDLTTYKPGKEHLKLTCIECKNQFDFPIEEQIFYKDRGLLPPKRCRDCRLQKRKRFNDKNGQEK